MNSLLDTAREHRAATSVVIGVGILVAAVLGYLFQPWQLFLDTEVDEAFPVTVAAADAGTTGADEPAAENDMADDGMAADEMAADEGADDTAGDESGAASTSAQEPAAEEPAEPSGPVLLASGEFQDRSHPASGTVGIFELEDGSRVLRIEDLETDNGPDLFVYLSAADADAPEGDFDTEFVSLGRLKGNIGSQNYEIPADVDLSRFASVVIWCDRFDVAFGSAALA